MTRLEGLLRPVRAVGPRLDWRKNILYIGFA
ncbi:MAG: hypothetical protein QOG77_2658, partial [Solirubrobacteraceae bacterium]|nr:hypothetical protein [Solirubrobacteraceae bacterium]